MNSRLFVGSAAGLVLVGWTGLAAAQSPLASQALTEQQVVAAAVAKNPTLHVALLRAQQNRYNLSAEEGLYTPLFDASAGYTHGRSPTLSGTTGVSLSESDVATLGAGITKPFAYGTVLSATVTGQRSYRSLVTATAPVAGGMTPITGSGSGPGYSLIGQVALTQPLLRGAGTDVGLASLRQAKLALTASQLAAQQSASSLLSQVVGAYWELWYASEVVRIDEASRELARVQKEQASQQVASGALAPASALPYATQLAELEESVLSAQTNVRQRELSLAQLLGEPRAVGGGLSAADAPSLPLAGEPPLEQAVDEALRTSYERKQLQTQLAIVKDQLKIAGEPLKPRLDLDAYVQAQGLGNRSVPPAFEQVGKLDAVSAHVGLTFELPLSDSRRTAQVQAAQFSAHVTQQQLAENELAIRSGVASAIAQRRAAGQRLELATQTEKVARAQAEAERARFVAGGSIAITVQQAEDSYRQAQLRVQRARVDLTLAELALTEQRGQLLSRYADAVRRLPAEQRVTLDRDASAAGNF